MDSLAFLNKPPSAKPRPIYAVHGEEDFLKRCVLAALRTLILGPDEDTFGLSTHAGDKATFAAVHDDVDTLPFLSPRRLVVVENADPFVTRYRPQLEKYFAEPASKGVLVLELRLWPPTTRLAKMLDDSATIVCKAPAGQRLLDWCVRWAASAHGKQLTAEAARANGSTRWTWTGW
jgi:DNA polymerase-3 subunit delta